MKGLKKFGAVFLAMAMCLSLCCTAFVSAANDDENYTITIKNASAEKTYQAYKIFDASYDSDTGSIVYSISINSAWYTVVNNGYFKDDDGGVVLVESPFTLTETSNMGVYTVTVKTTVGTDPDVTAVNDQYIIDFLVGYGVPEEAQAAATGTLQSNGTNVKLDVQKAGYYFVNTTTGSLVAITNAAPAAEVEDKSNTPGNLDKHVEEIEDDSYWGDHTDPDDNDVHADTEAMGDGVEFVITADVPLYDGANLVTDYTFEDTMSTGLYIELNLGDVDTSKTVNGVTLGNDELFASVSLIESWVTIKSASDDDFSLNLSDSGFVGDYYMILTGVTTVYDVDGTTVTGYTATGFKLYYTTWQTSYVVQDGDTAEDIPTGSYPVDATIEIDYQAHVTENAVYDNTNVITMTWRETPFNSPDPSNPKYTDSKTDKDDIYVLDLTVLKVDKTDPTKKLDGAVFKLEGQNLKDVVVSTSVTYTALNKTAYSSAKAAGTILYFALTDGSYTTVDPYDLLEADPAADVSKYVKDTQEQDYPYVAYTRTITSSTQHVDTENTSVTGTTVNGTVIFEGLTAGEYTLTEITAPEGYNLLDQPIKINISVKYETDGTPTWTITDGDDNTYTVDTSTGEIEIEVENQTGTELPGTGGIGTTIFYIIGGVLVVGAVVVLVTRRRMNREA